MRNVLKFIIGVLMAVIMLSTVITPLQALNLNTKAEYQGSTIEKPLIFEETKIIAGKETAAIISHAYYGGTISFNAIDISDDAFSHLKELIVIMENGTWDPDYWPYPLWPWPEGLTIVIKFEGLTIDDALSNAETILEMVKQELNIEGEIPLFHLQGQGDLLTLVYILNTINYYSVVDTWVDLLPVNVEDTLINVKNIKESNLTSVVFAVIEDKKEGGFISWMATMYVNPNAITVEDDEFTLSVNYAIGHEGAIYPAPDVKYSKLFIRIPYVGNVTYFDPPPDNLFPDMTGIFRYILEPQDWPVNNTGADDITIKYNFKYSNETKFPILKANYTVIPSNPIFDFNVTREIGFELIVTNVGDETAYNITTVIPMNPEDVEEKTLFEINATELFMWQLFKSLNKTEYLKCFEEMANYTLQVIGANIGKPEIAENATYIRWFTLIYYVSYIRKTIENFKSELMNQGLDEWIFVNSSVVYQNMQYDPNYLGASRKGLVAIVGSWDKLEPGESVTFSFKMVIPGIQNITEPVVTVTNSMKYPDKVYYNFTYQDPNTGENKTLFFEFDVPSGVKNGTRDGIIDGLNELRDRIVSNTTAKLAGEYLEFDLGPIVEYVDKIGHHLYVAANGFATQINSPEPVIIGTVEVDDYSLLINQNVTATVTLRNIGNANATDVEVSLYHAIADYGFEIKDKFFIGKEIIDELAAGEEVAIGFTRIVRTKIGLHPFYAEITYKDDDGKEITIYSNVIFAIVFPKRVPEPDYPYPCPEVEVTKKFEFESLNETSVGDVITVTVNITNVGTENTGIKIFEVFNSSALALKKVDENHMIKVYRTLPNGTQIDITDEITWTVHFNMTVDNFKVTVIEIKTKRGIGIRLGVNETITLVYKVSPRKAGSITIFPTKVEYTTRFPIEHKMEAGKEGEGETPRTKLLAKQGEVEAENVWAVYSGSLATYVQEAAEAFPQIAKLAIIGILTIVTVATIVVWRNRKKPLEEIEPLLTKNTNKTFYVIF